MRIEFDPAKDEINRDKHGISLIEAERLDWDSAVSWPDERYPYNEWRMIGWGLIGTRLYRVAYVEREGVTRVFSLRAAEKQEIKRYVRYLEGR